MGTSLLTLQNACAGIPEPHPLRVALVAPDSHERAFGPHDDYFWLFMRFGTYSAPIQLGELALNRREAAVLNTVVLNADRQTYRAVLRTFEMGPARSPWPARRPIAPPPWACQYATSLQKTDNRATFALRNRT